jgi:hypothetical protein
VWDPVSKRRQELPPDWPAIHNEVMTDAGGVCEMPGCSNPATDVDHKRRGNDHRRSNLQALCATHHKRKTSAEGNARKRELRALRKRPQGRHPGSL